MKAEDVKSRGVGTSRAPAHLLREANASSTDINYNNVIDMTHMTRLLALEHAKDSAIRQYLTLFTS